MSSDPAHVEFSRLVATAVRLHGRKSVAGEVLARIDRYLASETADHTLQLWFAGDKNSNTAEMRLVFSEREGYQSSDWEEHLNAFSAKLILERLSDV